MSVFDRPAEIEQEITDPYEETPNDLDVDTESEEVETQDADQDGDYIDTSDEEVAETPDQFAKFEEKLDEISSKYEQRIAQLEAQLQNVAAKDANVELASYDAAIARLKAERREALSMGDMDTFEAAEEQLDKIKGEKAELELKLKQKAPPAKAPPPPEFVTWNKSNKWFGTNEEMTQVALAIGPVIEKQNPGMNPVQILAKVSAYMKAKYPKAFAVPANMNKTNNTGTRQKGGNGKSYRDLPADAKAACDEWVSEGKMTQEQYVKSYYES